MVFHVAFLFEHFQIRLLGSGLMFIGGFQHRRTSDEAMGQIGCAVLVLSDKAVTQKMRRKHAVPGKQGAFCTPYFWLSHMGWGC